MRRGWKSRRWKPGPRAFSVACLVAAACWVYTAWQQGNSLLWPLLFLALAVVSVIDGGGKG